MNEEIPENMETYEYYQNDLCKCRNCIIITNYCTRQGIVACVVAVWQELTSHISDLHNIAFV